MHEFKWEDYGIEPGMIAVADQIEAEYNSILDETLNQMKIAVNAGEYVPLSIFFKLQVQVLKSTGTPEYLLTDDKFLHMVMMLSVALYRLAEMDKECQEETAESLENVADPAKKTFWQRLLGN